tara:strand:- start:137 stop:571 length:435 start_codon:yes stop_codon:yes gene_type:complete
MYTLFSNILAKESVLDYQYSQTELETFIESLHGDVRRGLTELQAAYSSQTPLRNQIDKNLSPYTEILKLVNNNDYQNALDGVHNLLYDSVDMKTVCINLHDTIIKTELANNQKFKLLRVVGEAEWRSSNSTPKVLASWMIGQMM